MAIISNIKSRWRQNIQQWMNRRVPRARSITLDQRRIFIFPSHPGLLFLLVLLVMFIAAVNYQNSMAFALVFLLVSVFIIAVLHTYANLSGLTITAVRADPAFAGDFVEFELLVSREGNRDYYDIALSWGLGANDVVSLRELSERSVILRLQIHQRGLFTPERLLVESFYPLGLLRAWTWIALDIDALIYPRPVVGNIQFPVSSESDQGEVTEVMGSDEFYDFRAYQAGDSLKHIYWKSYAKGLSLQTKQYQSYAEKRVWLDWELATGDIEQRLSLLCYWVLALEKSNDEYGLRLPGVNIAPGSGERHKMQVLKVLALFDLTDKGAV